ncbi:MAG: 60S ribosomal export protein NMD3, partial [Methanoregulaceae archaeon]|nr:60S ribosomal export protein NMD3 [Methanoregulaceae archaeon]
MKERTIRDSICPRCGGPSEDAGACDKCRAGKTEWFTCDRRVVNTGCPSCGARKSAGVWTDDPVDRSTLAVEVARSGVRFHPDLVSPSAVFRIVDLSANRSAAEVTLSGTLYGEPVTGHCRMEILW